MVKKTIAIIPARGGSKRLLKKNIMDFMGLPMIAWTIKAAKESSLFDTVLVSTDCEEIAEISIQYGAEVPFLRYSYADEMTPVSAATSHALKQMEEAAGEKYDVVVQLMPNCPLRTANSIKSQHEFFLSFNQTNSVLSGFKYGMFNPWWAHIRNKDGSYSRFFKDHINVRSQDLPDLICPTGATWITKRDSLLKYESFYSPNYHFYIIDWKEAVDIDDHHDLELAKTAYYITNGI